MKTSTLNKLFLSALLLGGNWAIAGTFNSNGTGGGQWNSVSSWVYQNDADGIPDADDDVTILTGDIILLNVNSPCHNVTIEIGGELKCVNSKYLQIYGDFQNLGKESGNGFYCFRGLNKFISGSGVFSANSKWHFYNQTSIQSDVVTIKNSITRFYQGAIVNNFGNIRVNGIENMSASIGKWVNATGSVLTLRSHTVTVDLDVSTFENTVKTMLGLSNGTLPSSISNTYYHLEIRNSNYVVSLGSDITINGDFTVLTGGDFDMNGFNIHLKGNFANYQNFIQPATSTLYMDGTSTQSLNSFISPTELSNLVIDNANGVNTGGYEDFTISNSLVINNGLFDLEKNRITLLSDENNTAYIGTSNGTVTGTMTIQRFISDRNDGYSDMSSPLTTTSFYDWTDDLDLAFVAYIPNYSSPSCWSYDESLYDYVAVESYNEELIPGRGYEVYLDNDGSTATSFSGSVTDLIGTPNVGTIYTPVTIDNDGWNLIGNPYAAPIDWTSFRTNCGLNMSSQFQYYDETINDFNIGNDGELIAAGQGFWIEATEAGNAAFQESNKVANTTSAFRSMNDLRFSLRVSSEINPFTSNTFLSFHEGATAEYGEGDLKFMKSPSKEAPALYTVAQNNIKMKLNTVEASDELMIPVHFKAAVSGRYEISSHQLDIILEEGYEIILEDKFTGIRHHLSEGSYFFNATVADSADRFTLHLLKNRESVESVTEWVNILPSPAGIEVEVLTDTDKQISLSVYNLAGQEIVSTQVLPENNNRFTVRMPEGSAGIYIVTIHNGEQTESKKIYRN